MLNIRSVARNLLIRFQFYGAVSTDPIFVFHTKGVVSAQPLYGFPNTWGGFNPPHLISYSKGMISNHPLAITRHILLYGVKSNHPILLLYLSHASVS